MTNPIVISTTDNIKATLAAGAITTLFEFPGFEAAFRFGSAMGEPGMVITDYENLKYGELKKADEFFVTNPDGDIFYWHRRREDGSIDFDARGAPDGYLPVVVEHNGNGSVKDLAAFLRYAR